MGGIYYDSRVQMYKSALFVGVCGYYTMIHRYKCIKMHYLYGGGGGYNKYDSGPLNRTSILYMTTSASRRLNISCIMFKIIAFFIITLFSRLCVRVGISLTQVKHLHDGINSLRGGEVLPQK